MSQQPPPPPPPPTGPPYPGPPPEDEPTQPITAQPAPAGPPPPPPTRQYAQEHPRPPAYSPPPPYAGPPGPPSGPPPWTPGPGPGGPGGPQRPSRTGLYVGIGALVAALVIAFCVTAFAAPGFLVGDDDASSQADSGSGGSGSDDPASADAEAVLEAVADGFDDTDTAALEALACPDADASVAGSTASAAEVEDAELGDVVDESDTEVSADFTVTVGGSDYDFLLVVADPGDGWCWQELPTTAPSDAPSPADPSDSATSPAPEAPTAVPSDPTSPDTGADEAEGNAVMSQFVDALNAGDSSGATSLLCPDAGSTDILVDDATTQGVELTLDVDETVTGIGSVLGELSGKQGGTQLEDGGIIATATDGSWCVSTFYVY